MLTRKLFYTLIRLNVLRFIPCGTMASMLSSRRVARDFLFLPKSLVVGDLSLDNSETTSIEVPLLVLVFCDSSSHSLSELGYVELVQARFLLAILACSN